MTDTSKSTRPDPKASEARADDFGADDALDARAKARAAEKMQAEKAASLIPVASITFRTGVSCDLPGKTVATGLTASKPSLQQFWRIWLDLRLRAFRVEFFSPGKEIERAPTGVVYVPSEWAAWKPLVIS